MLQRLETFALHLAQLGECWVLLLLFLFAGELDT